MGQIKSHQTSSTTGIKRYGELQDFELDSIKKTITASILPRGEKEAIAIVQRIPFHNHVTEYSCCRVHFHLTRMADSIAEDYLVDNEYKCPSG